MKTALLFLLFVAAPAFASAAGAQPGGQMPDYEVGPEDVLSVTVVGEDDLTKKYTVGNDGAFEFPWIGRVEAKGQTLRTLEQLIKRRLEEGKFLVNPQVTIEVVTFRSQRVYVLGQVKNPGNYSLTGGTTILDLVNNEAGGILSDAADEILVYKRKGSHAGDDGPLTAEAEDVEVIRIKKVDLISGRARNIVLRNGDTINVPKGLAIFVTGHVKSPNRYAMEGQLTVLQAITLAGGPTERASMSKIRILRQVNGKEKEIKAKLTDLVQPGDTIKVGAKWF